MTRAAFLALAIILAPLSAQAHAFGVSHETTVDGIHIDIGYSSAAPTVGESVIFDFNLPAGEEDERYTDVWVRVEAENGSAKLATAVHNATFGGPRMSYAFPEPGVYTLFARYENEGTALAKTEWQITVLPSSSGGFRGILQSIPWTWLIAGALIGAAGVFLSLRPSALRAYFSKRVRSS